MPEQEKALELRIFWNAEKTEDHALLGVKVKTFVRAQGNSVLRVRDHVLVLVANEAIQTTRIDGSAPRDLHWPANSIGFIPAGMRREGRLIEPVNVTLVQMAHRFFEHSAFESIEPDRACYRYLYGLTDKIGLHLCDTLRALAIEGKEHEWPLLLGTVATSVAVRSMQLLGAQRVKPDTPYPTGGLPRERLRRVLEYIESYIHRPIDLPELASVAALSPYHFARAFRAAIGLPPVRYVWQRRGECAKRMMRKAELPLANVAFGCGFSSQSHFTTVFKRETGLTPTEYRARL